MSAITLPIRLVGLIGTREVDALLDTGASYLVISTEDAIDVGYDLALAPKFPAVTANGVIEAPLIVLKSVILGEYAAKDVSALCINMAGNRVSSLLGLSFLSHFRVCIDSKGKWLVIEDC